MFEEIRNTKPSRESFKFSLKLMKNKSVKCYVVFALSIFPMDCQLQQQLYYFFSINFMVEGPDVAVDIISCYLMPPDFLHVVSSYSKELSLREKFPPVI